MPKPDTMREAYVQASSFLLVRGVADSRSCAELLLQHLFGWSRSHLLLHWSDPFPEDKLDEWERLVERKAHGEPVQYIMGEQPFFGLPFRVTPAVLIPRPETELLVEVVMAQGRLLPRAGLDDVMGETTRESAETLAAAAPVVVDIGTGSGAIAVSLAKHNPSWRMIATDLSPKALAVARTNAELNGVADQIHWLEGDLLEPLIQAQLHVDILVSNPPYIREEDIEGLQPEVKYYEPRLALAGGKDGLDYYRRLTAGLAELPVLPRIVGFEVGMGQAQEVAAMLNRAYTWDEVQIVRDLAGIDRHVVAFRR